MGCSDLSFLKALGRRKSISKADEPRAEDLDALRAEMRRLLIRGLATYITRPFRLAWSAVHRNRPRSNE